MRARHDTNAAVKRKMLVISSIFAAVLLLLSGGAVRVKTNELRAAERVKSSSEGLLSPASPLPMEGRMPSLDGLQWIGAPALRSRDLRGKVVLVDFWTYSCINCIRVVPYLNAWANKYRADGLIVLGVHTPEFSFEKRPENIEAERQRFHIEYPTLVDSDYKVWNAFGNQYWPAYYLVDSKGYIRYHQFGEGDYDKAEAAIQKLLSEAHGQAVQSAPVSPVVNGAFAPASPGGVGSPETYLGYRQAEHFASPQRVKKDNASLYTVPTLSLNHWALSGRWVISAENASTAEAGAALSYRFRARDLNLVMGPQNDGKPIAYHILIDGHAPGPNHGTDTDADGRGVIERSRLYQLIRQQQGAREATFEIHFDAPGAKVFVFTFG